MMCLSDVKYKSVKKNKKKINDRTAVVERTECLNFEHDLHEQLHFT